MVDANIQKINYKKDVIINTVAQLLYLFALWLMTILTPRFGSSADAGIFTICLSVSNICTAIATYSINFYVASDIKHRFTDQHYFYFGLTSTFISLLVSIIISLSFGYFTDNTLFWAVVLYYVFKCAENLTVIITASMQRAGKLYISGYALIVKAVLALGIFSLTLFLTKNIVLAFGILAAFGIIYFMFVDFILLKKFTNVSYKFTKEIYKVSLKLFVLAFTVFLYGISFASIVSFPRMVLDQFATKEVVGYFGSMAAISTLIQSALSALLIPFLPKVTDSYLKNDKKDLLKTIVIFAIFIIGATGAAFLCACFLDKWLVGIVYPYDPTALEYAHYFKWIIAATGVQAFVILSSLTLISFRKLFILGISSALGLSFMFLCSDFLIPSYNINGVIYTYIISYGLFFAIGAISIIYYIKNNKNKIPKPKHIKITKDKDKEAEKMSGLASFHNECFEILKKIDEIAKENKIMYSTYGGTMLGHVRHKGFIPWDDDVDVLMTRDNFDKFFSVWSDTKQFKLLTPLSYHGDFVDVIYRIVNKKHSYNNFGDFKLYKDLSHPWVDVFVLDNAPKSRLRLKCHTMRLKILYGMMCSRKRINLHLNRPLIERIGMFAFKIIGKPFSLNFLYNRFIKISKKYSFNKKYNNYYHVSNCMTELDKHFSSKYVNKTIYMPFNNSKIQCYIGYDHILKSCYHDYMEPRIDISQWIRHFDISKYSDEEIATFYLK